METSELIELLQQMPADAEVCIYVDCADCGCGGAASDIEVVLTDDNYKIGKKVVLIEEK